MDLLKRENFSSGAPFEEKVGYSRAVKVGNMVFVGGTTSTNSEGVVEGAGDAYLQTKIILQKIERIKQMIDNDEFTLSEIAFMMDYSSVQYLSAQFHKITDMTVSEYKVTDRSSKNPLDKIY